MKEIGALGEKLVGRWLELQNYNLLRQSWRCRWGEIDIIAQDKASKTVAFVEVKTRSKNNWDEGGLLAIDSIKQEKIIKTASLFLAEYPQLGELPCRFDVALVGCKKYFAQLHRTPQPIRRENADADIDLKDIISLEIGQFIEISQYQLAIENYLQSAFELS